jgi:D-serine dehydratase
MSERELLPPPVSRLIAQKEPCLWLNPGWLPIEEARADPAVTLQPVYEAERRLGRYSGLLAQLFPELSRSGGTIESPLLAAERLRSALGYDGKAGRWLIKADHALPVVGSIKARGGFHEVLFHAETLAVRAGLMKARDDGLVLAAHESRALFAQRQVVVGSTGNLGMSIGIMAAALGFHATVHMSADAKVWKKQRLRACGVEVIEHKGDFGCAVAAGRALASKNPQAYFVDDEQSEHLFFGYAVAAVRLEEQLAALAVTVNAQQPLFVYLPCGVGGSPGGITFGLRQLFGDHVHCFFAEPVSSPCMLIRLASASDEAISVRAVGLDNCTEADGLAVAQASELVVATVRSLVSGIFTVRDRDLFAHLYVLERSEGLRIEPSAAAGFGGPRWLLESAPGRQYLRDHDLVQYLDQATHILWTTGGALVPEDEYRQFHERGWHEWLAIT